jgi:hypothetical protein
MDKKCAPNKKFIDGSCINEETLKKIAINFNINHNTKIDHTQNKKELVEELTNNFEKKYQCKDQLCWLNQNFVKRMKNEELQKYTFRPKGPNNKLDWLSTTHINDVIDQYELKHDDFIFLGAVPYDFQELRELHMGKELNFNDLINGKLNEKHHKNNKINHFGMVINLDTHDKPGSHWVSLYSNFDKNQIYFFDSFGKKPKKKIKKFINKLAKFMYKRKYNQDLSINKLIKDIKQNVNSDTVKNMSKLDIRYNDIQHQIENTECGVYSINFIIRLAKGETFDHICKNITRDKEMNGCREKYFSNF